MQPGRVGGWDHFFLNPIPPSFAFTYSPTHTHTHTHTHTCNPIPPTYSRIPHIHTHDVCECVCVFVKATRRRQNSIPRTHNSNFIQVRTKILATTEVFIIVTYRTRLHVLQMQTFFTSLDRVYVWCNDT